MANTRVNIDVNINTSDAARNLRQLQAQINSFQSALNTNNRLQGDASRYYSQQIKDLANQSGMFSAETVKMRTAASQLDQTLSKGQGTMRQFVSAKFLKDSAAAAQVLSLANSRASALQTQFVATGAAANGFREAVAIRPLQAFNSETAISAQKLAIHRAMLSQSTTSMINFGKNTQWAGRQLMVGFTVPLTIFAATAGKVFREIEKESLNFRKVYGDSFTTPEELNANLLAVQGLAKEYTKYGIAVKDTIGLAAQAAAAGSQGADLIDATTEATRLATLGQMDQNQALETTIALQTAFNLSGKDLSKTINFLNMVENQTVVTLQDLAQAIPRVAPVIKGLGGSVEDMAVMLAAMREGGITAAQGANALKSGLASLINPTDRAVESLDKMGINLNSIINMNRGDLLGTVKSFGEALATLDEFSRQQALEKVFGKFQYARLGALFNNIVKDGSQASRVMDTATMSAEQLAKSAEKELGAIEDSAATKFVAAMEKLKLAIAPIGEMFIQMATPVLGLLGSLVDKFNELPDFAKKFIGFGTVITGIIIPAGTMFLGLLMNLAGTLTKFGLVVGVAFKGFAQGGLKGSVEAVSQALNFMSLAEIDAATASSQLGTSTEIVNAALRDQVPAAAGADAAIDSLSRSYAALIVQMTEAATLSRVAFVAPGAAMAGAAATGAEAGKRRGGPRVRRNSGGTIPGSGNTDTVPAMLTPGEFVVNKQATGENLALLHAINKGREVPGFNKGGQIPGMQYFGGRSPGGNVQQMDDAWKADQATFAGMFGIGGNRRTQASNTASSRGSENIYNNLTGNYERGQNVRVDTLRYAVEKLGFNPQQLGLKTRGNLTFRMSKDSNLAMMRGDLTRENLLKELETPDVYSPLARQLDSYLGARLDTNAFDRMYREEIGKLPLTGINNGRFEKASRNAVRRYLDSAGFPKARRNSFIRDVLQGDTVNANMSLPAIKQALDARGIQYTSGQSKKDLYVDMDGRQVNIGNLAGRESGNLGRPQGILDYAGLRGSGEAVHANKGGMIPGMQYLNGGNIAQLIKNIASSRNRIGGVSLQRTTSKGVLASSPRRIYDEEGVDYQRWRSGKKGKGYKDLLERGYITQKEYDDMVGSGRYAVHGVSNEFIASMNKMGASETIGSSPTIKLKDLLEKPENKNLQYDRNMADRMGDRTAKIKPSSLISATPQFNTQLGTDSATLDSLGPIGGQHMIGLAEQLMRRGVDKTLARRILNKAARELRKQVAQAEVKAKKQGRKGIGEAEFSDAISAAEETALINYSDSLILANITANKGGMVPMLNGGGIAAAANAARGARGRIPANIVEWFSRMTTSISQSNRDDMLQNIPANIRRGLSTARRRIDITRGSVDPIDGGTLKEVSSWSTGQGVGRFMESSKLFDTMNNSKFQIAQTNGRMKRDLDSLKSLGPDGPRNSWSQFHQANGGLSLRLTPEEIQESGGVIWKANKKKLEERIRKDQEFIAGHQKIIDDLQESNIPTIYRTSVKKGEKYFDVSDRIVPREDQRLNNPAASNAILEEKEVALLGARLTGRAKTRIVEREEAQARYDKAKEEIKRIRMAIFNKETSAEKAKPDLDRLHDETENMAAFVNWGRGREVTYPSIVSRNMGGMIPGIQQLMAGARVQPYVRPKKPAGPRVTELEKEVMRRRAELSVAKDQGLNDLIFRRNQDGKLDLAPEELLVLLRSNPNVSDKQLKEIAKYHSSRIKKGMFGHFDRERGYKTVDRSAGTWRSISQVLDERGYPVVQKRNIGGQIFDSTKTSRTIVPGVGNKDTVPAALTPGEFVINKDATRKNLDLLRAVNNGSVSKYALGGVVRAYALGDVVDDGNGQYLVEGREGRTFGPMTEEQARRRSRQLLSIERRQKRRTRSRQPRADAPNRGMMGGRGMGASMGLGAIGSTMMMAPMFLPGLQENAMLSSAMPIAGAATTALSTLAMLPPPVAIAAAAITALGAAAIVTKTKFDEISRSAADAGSKLGGTANRMEKISAATGYQFAKDRVTQRDFRFSQQEGQDVMEFAPYFESESGQKLIEELKNLKAEDRYKEVGSIIAMAVADGMDLKTAKAYGQSIAFYTNDALLKFRLEGAFKRGEFRSGTDAMTQLIESRVQEASKIVIPEPPDSVSSPLSQALGTTGTTNLIGEGALSTLPGGAGYSLSFINEMLEEQGNFFERLGKIDKGALLKQLIPGGAIPGLIQDGQEFAKTVEATGRVFGSSIQVLKEVDNLEAAIIEQRRKGSISADEYAAQIARVRQIQDVTSERLKEAFTLNQDIGVNQQAISSQLILGGFEGDLAGAISNQVNDQNIGEKLFGEFDKNNDAQQEVVSQVMTQILSGLTPENAASRLAEIETVYGSVADKLLSAAADGLTAAEAKSIILEGQIKNFVETALAVPDSEQSGQDRFLEGKQNPTIETNLTALEKSGAFQEVGGISVITQSLSEFEDVDFARTIALSAKETIRFTNLIKELSELPGIEIDIATKYMFDQDITPEQVKKQIDDLTKYGNSQQKTFAKKYGKKDSKIISNAFGNPQKIFNEFADAMNKNGSKTMEDLGVKNAKDYFDKITSTTDVYLNKLNNNLNKKGTLKINAEVVTELFGIPAGDAESAAKMLNDMFGNQAIDPSYATVIASLQFSNPGAFAALASVAGDKAILDFVKGGGKVGEGITGKTGKYGPSILTQEQFDAATIALSAPTFQGSGQTPTNPGPGGGGQKSMIQQLKDEFKSLQDVYQGFAKNINKKTGMFKDIAAGPFGQQFINYLMSQGEEGIKVLKEKGKKFNEAYKAFVNVQMQAGKNFMQQLPSLFGQQRLEMTGQKIVTDQLAKQGFSEAGIETILSGAQEGELAALAKAKAKKKKNRTDVEKELVSRYSPANTKKALQASQQLDRTTRDEFVNNEQKAFDLQNALSGALAGKNIDPEVIDMLIEMGYTAEQAATNIGEISKHADKLNSILLQTSFRDEMKGLSEETKNANTALDLMGRGIPADIANQISGMGNAANFTEDQVAELVTTMQKLEILKLALQDPAELRLQQLMGQERINQLNYEIGLIESVNAKAEMQALYTKEGVTNHEDLLAVYERQNEAKSRQIEMRQRDLEPLDEEIKKLEEQKTKIEENYNAQSEALDKVIEKENELFAIKAKSLDVAGALSRGDVAGAAKAALELERELSQQRAQDQKQMLDQQRQLSIEAIDTRIKTIADEKKVIEEDILRLQKEQRGIQDSIYNAQVIINNESARLESLYKLGNSQLDILKQELILAEIEQRKLNAAVQEQIDLLERLNRAKQGQPTSQTTTAPTDYSNYVFPDPSLNLNEQQSAEILAALENLIPADFNPFAGLSGFFANGGKVFSSGMSKYLMGGRVGYKGSTERAPGMMYGGSAKKYAYGSTVPGRGMTDKVPALLTPGEFVVRKRVAEQYGPLLESLNGQVFPKENFDKDSDEDARRKKDMDMMGATKEQSRSSLIDAVKNASRGELDKLLAISNQNSKDRVRLGVEPNRFNTGNLTGRLNDFRAMSNQKVFPTMKTNSFNSSSQTEKSGSMYNYNVNVTLNGSDMDANDVANVVIQKIKMVENKGIRSNNIRG